MSFARQDAHPLIRKLESISSLTEDERSALMRLPLQVVQLDADQDITREGDSPSRCCGLLEGYTCTYKVTEQGKRQIMAFHIAGDIPDLHSLHLKVLDSSLGTLTPCKVAFIQHEALRHLCSYYPRITAALWRSTLVDASIFREWVTNLGRREAYSRMAHILCEWVVRLNAVGLAEGHSCEFPITQGELADATGISGVHVNRVLQDLRAAGLITLKGNALTVLNWTGLREVAGFDPTYLHLE